MPPETCRVLLLPPSADADRASIEDSLQRADWHPLSGFPNGREGEIVIIYNKEAQALIAHGYAVHAPMQAENLDLSEEIVFADLAKRMIFQNPLLVSLNRMCERWHLQQPTLRLFRPAAFSAARFEEFRKAIVALRWPPREQGVFEHLWTSSPDSHLPLELLMIDEGDYLPDDFPPVAEQKLAALSDRHLVVARQASLVRDGMVSELSEKLSLGKIAAKGFDARDGQRRMVEIPPAWWRDPRMVCDLQNGEIRPCDEAPPGSPHFRGLLLIQAANRPAHSRSSSRPGPKSTATAMQEICKMLSDEGQTFSTIVEEHRAVLMRLGVKGDPPRGYAYQTFAKMKASSSQSI